MKQKKMKTYVITVSRNFPAKHPRKGQETLFVAKIINGVRYDGLYKSLDESPDTKIHTIRANYNLWKKRIDHVNAGKAILSIRYWSGKPYNSKQTEFMQLDKHSGCGVQRLEKSITIDGWLAYTETKKQDFYSEVLTEQLSKHDGLILQDFKDWFKGYDLTKPMAIIQFTSFRY